VTDHVLTSKLQLKVKPMTDQARKLDKVAETYVKIRDARAALKKQYEAEDNALKDQLATLDGFLLETMQSLGAESVRTKHGTVYLSVSVKPNCGDWNALYAWITENDAFDVLERRVKKSFIVDYMKENKDELPPGISVLHEYTVTIRRS
jgi:hypothetical protein